MEDDRADLGERAPERTIPVHQVLCDPSARIQTLVQSPSFSDAGREESANFCPVFIGTSFAQLADEGVSFKRFRSRSAWKHLKLQRRPGSRRWLISVEPVCEFGRLLSAAMADSPQYGCESLLRRRRHLRRSLQ